MRNNETGEFELVVGNRQLLSGFFIVVLLFAVAFAMGYVVGQNAPRSAKLAADSGNPPGIATAASDGRDTRPLPASPVPQLTPAESAAQRGNERGTERSQPLTQPSTQPSREEISASAPPARTAAASGSPALIPGADLPSGSFWQLMAIRQPEAEAMRQTLRDKGFPAVLSPGPNNLTRVLVGPYADTQTFGRAKSELESAGFQSPVRYRRD